MAMTRFNGRLARIGYWVAILAALAAVLAADPKWR
jgi:hypothetical protein